MFLQHVAGSRLAAWQQVLQSRHTLGCRGDGRDGNILLLQVAAPGQRRGRRECSSLLKGIKCEVKVITRAVGVWPGLFWLLTGTATRLEPLHYPGLDWGLLLLMLLVLLVLVWQLLQQQLLLLWRCLNLLNNACWMINDEMVPINRKHHVCARSLLQHHSCLSQNHNEISTSFTTHQSLHKSLPNTQLHVPCSQSFEIHCCQQRNQTKRQCSFQASWVKSLHVAPLFIVVLSPTVLIHVNVAQSYNSALKKIKLGKNVSSILSTKSRKLLIPVITILAPSC